MTYDRNNVFAKILRGELPSHKVYEDDTTLAFMDVMPQADGHVLVIPKLAEARNMHDCPPDALRDVIATTQHVAAAVKTAMNAPGVMIAQLNEAEAGQTVFHLHFHIIPRWHGVDFRLHARGMEDPAKLAGFAEKIRAALDA